ncbi:hypothetical protein [Streptomyces sp. NPDC059009]|uniref:hypothetical protein n=1 Tax=Streptomyces sp. NPDC059009 TaxID=3346694 RepID=UPI0036B7F035
MPQDVEFAMPYPRKVAPDLSTALPRHMTWATHHALVSGDDATAMYRFSQHAEVGAWFCPSPETEQDLDLQLDINGWYFVFDDAFDVPAGRTPDTAVSICLQLMERLGTPPGDTGPAASRPRSPSRTV